MFVVTMRTAARNQAGFSLIEAMATVVVMTFGVLGVAGLVSKSYVMEVEATQRTQAVMLLQDMVTRIEANRTNAASYVTGDVAISGSTHEEANCAEQAVPANRDRCEWGQLLAGAERIDGVSTGVLVGARGCIYEIDAFNRIYAVSIAWEGLSPSAEPIDAEGYAPNGCGRDQYGNENRRRVMSTQLRIGFLGP